MFHAKNMDGQVQREAQSPFKIVCGPTIALTPPMGWNSWNCWAGSVSDEKVRAAADAMVKSGLVNHGWTYINIDDYWEFKPEAKDDPTLQGEARDKDGFINPNKRFPDMKALTDYVHSKGLKIGLYSSPGPTTCGGCIASYQHEEQDAQRWAEWGFDYVKYDWCSYGGIAPKNPNLDEMKKPYQVMRAALDKQPRDIVYSLCQYGMGNVWEWGAEVGGNCWRTTGDITDTWGSLSNIGFHQTGHEAFAGPGHWNDPDMLIVGYVGWSSNLHPTRLTPDEQYTHISLWCLLSAPLLIGCDMTRLDDFTLSLLTNDRVLAANQDPLGKQARQISNKNYAQVWAKEVEDGVAVGLFNLDDDPQEVSVKWSDLNIQGTRTVVDLWRQKEVGDLDGAFKAMVPAHGVVLVQILPNVRL
jgi:alpha-galactosidase